MLRPKKQSPTVPTQGEPGAFGIVVILRKTGESAPTWKFNTGNGTAAHTATPDRRKLRSRIANRACLNMRPTIGHLRGNELLKC
jgi:hypothetical protein